MDSSEAIELGRDAMRVVIKMGGPILLIGLILGMVVGMLQSMTQVHDQTVGFVPKVIGLILAIGLGLPWLSEQMIDYSRSQFARPAIPILPVQHPPKQLIQSTNGTLSLSVTPSNDAQSNGVESTESQSDNRPTNPFQLPRHRISRLPKVDQEL